MLEEYGYMVSLVLVNLAKLEKIIQTITSKTRTNGGWAIWIRRTLF